MFFRRMYMCSLFYSRVYVGVFRGVPHILVEAVSLSSFSVSCWSLCSGPPLHRCCRLGQTSQDTLVSGPARISHCQCEVQSKPAEPSQTTYIISLSKIK